MVGIAVGAIDALEGLTVRLFVGTVEVMIVGFTEEGTFATFEGFSVAVVEGNVEG